MSWPDPAGVVRRWLQSWCRFTRSKGTISPPPPPKPNMGSGCLQSWAGERYQTSGGASAVFPRTGSRGRGDAMTTLRAFTCDDLFRFNNINLDPLTETYGIPFYLQYLAHWPEYFIVAEAPGGELMGYIMGKAEGSVAREEWHGHVTALSVAPEFRRLGLAAKLMELLEEISER